MEQEKMHHFLECFFNALKRGLVCFVPEQLEKNKHTIRNGKRI